MDIYAAYPNSLAAAEAMTRPAAIRGREPQALAALADLTAFRDTDYLMTPLPPTLILRAGDQLRVYDNNNVAGTDDMVVQTQFAEREV